MTETRNEKKILVRKPLKTSAPTMENNMAEIKLRNQVVRMGDGTYLIRACVKWRGFVSAALKPPVPIPQSSLSDNNHLLYKKQLL
jgi:hypothetical protein